MAEDRMERAEKLLAEGDYLRAAGEFERAAAADDRPALAYVGWGRALLALGRTNGAREKFELAIKADPNDVDAHVRAGELDISLGNYQEAAERFQHATELDGRRADAYFGWGNALYNLERREQARWRFDEATAADETFIRAYLASGQILSELGQLKEAASRFERATELDEGNAAAWNFWGEALLGLRSYSEALARFEAAIKADKLFSLAYLNLGKAAIGLRQYERAAEAVDEAAKIDAPTFAASDVQTPQKGVSPAIAQNPALAAVAARFTQARRLGGYAYSLLGRQREARVSFEQALSITPGDDLSRVGLAETLMKLRLYDEAREQYERAAKAGGTFAAMSHHNTSAIFWRQGRYDKAWKELDQARLAYEEAVREQERADGVESEATPFEWALLLIDYGNALLALSDFSGARQRLEQACDLDPEEPGSFIGLTNLHLEERKAEAGAGEGKYWQARAPFEKAKELLEAQLQTQRDVPLLLKLANLHLSIEEDEEAERFLKEVREREPGSVESLAGLAAVAARRDDFKSSARYLSEAVRREPDNLTNRTNLADVYARLELWERAEREYRTVLAISASHIEAQIGLGQVLMELGEHDDVLFESAKSTFEEALRLAKTMQGGADVRAGSSELTTTQFAETLYALGRAKVKLYEARLNEGIFLRGADRNLLNEARRDFQKASKIDETNHKARRAVDRIQRELAPFAPQRVANEWAPRVVAGLAITLLVLVQLNFFVGHVGKQIEAVVFFPLSLGLLLFIIAAFYLPQLLRLKVAGIELEKSSTEQITQPQTLGIGR